MKDLDFLYDNFIRYTRGMTLIVTEEIIVVSAVVSSQYIVVTPFLFFLTTDRKRLNLNFIMKELMFLDKKFIRYTSAPALIIGEETIFVSLLVRQHFDSICPERA